MTDDFYSETKSITKAELESKRKKIVELLTKFKRDWCNHWELNPDEITIRERASEFFGRPTGLDLPILIGGSIDEILNCHGFGSDEWDELENRLGDMGCVIEPYDSVTWTVGCNYDITDPDVCRIPTLSGDKLQKITNDLLTANKAGMEAAGKVSDGGTANLDSLRVKIPEPLEENVKILGTSTKLSIFPNGREGNATVLGGGGWQGFKRTAWAEAAANKLEELGYKAWVHYVMD